MQELLFQFNPELFLRYLSIKSWLGRNRLLADGVANIPTKVLGIEFKNPVGLAAGIDCNGDYLNALSNLGFGFIEIGTITPQPQVAHIYPRVCAAPKIHGLINRAGFVNKGVEALYVKLRNMPYEGVLGINIGKNLVTPIENAVEDYKYCIQRLYNFASYFTVNESYYQEIKSFIMQNQNHKLLSNLLINLKQTQLRLADKYGRYVPLVIKFSLSINNTDLRFLLDEMVKNGIDGIVAGGGAITADSRRGEENCYLSGTPLKQQAESVLIYARDYLQGAIPIISVGGIVGARDGINRLNQGASLIQICTGLIYFGPILIKKTLQIIHAKH